MVVAASIMLSASSCLFSDKDAFKQTASARMTELMQDAKTAISRHPEGFVLQYFAKEGKGGYNFVVRFDGGKAYLSCETAESDRVDECLWDIIKEDGAILTFNTYCSLLQRFHEPSFTDVDGDGGDYEFQILGVDKDDMIHLKGKLGGSRMQMFPLPEGYTPVSWLDAVKQMEKGWKGDFYVYSSDSERLASTVGCLGGKVLCVTEGLYPSSTTYKYKRSAVYTPYGFKLQSQLVLNGYYGQDFILKDNEFVAVDGDLVFTSTGLVPPSYEEMAGVWMLRYDNYFSKYFVKAVVVSTSKDGETLYIKNLFSATDLDNVKLKYVDGRLELYPQYLGRYSGYYVWGLLFDTKQSTVMWDENTCMHGVYSKENDHDVFYFCDSGTAVGDYSADGLILYEFTTPEPSTSTQVDNLDILCNICLYR